MVFGVIFFGGIKKSMTLPTGYIKEFHNIPIYLENLIKISDLFLIIKTFVDTNTALDMCFNIGLSIAKQGYYHTIINQTQERFYNWVDIKMILLTNFDGRYSYFEQLTTGSEDIQYDNMS